MKKLSRNLFALLLMTTVSAFIACGGDNEPDPQLEISTTSITADAAGVTESFNITSNEKWSISGYPSWLTVTPTQGENSGIVSIIVHENTTTKSRSAQLKINTLEAKLNQIVFVEQSGAEVKLSTDLAVVALAGDANSKQDLNIYTNTSWNLAGVPEWLNVSAVSGNGDSKITIEAISDNSSSSERTATLRFTAENQQISVDVKQRGLLAPVSVTPKDLVALWDGVCFELDATGDIHSFYCVCIEESEVNRLTDKEIVRRALQEEELTYSDGYMISRGLNAAADGEAYYVCTVAFDKTEKQGDLIKTRVEMPVYADVDNDAWVSMQYSITPYSSFDYIAWDFTKQAYCNKYHAIIGSDIREDYIINSLEAAFEINYFMKYGKKHWLAENWAMEIVTNYPNNHVFDSYHLRLYPYCFAYTWGVYENGKLSSDVVGTYFNVEEETLSYTRSVGVKTANRHSENEWKILTINEVREAISNRR